jgi:hypothetical protein
MNAFDLRALKTLQRPLGVLAAVIAIGAILLYYTDLALQSAQRAAAQQQNQLREARIQLNKSGEEKATIVRYLGKYQYLQQLGFVGDEQRISWLDGLRLANRETRLFGVDYQIGAQQPYPYAAELDPGQLTLYQSVMKINLKLLHEDDLMRFLGTLAQHGAGVFSVNQCVMERIEAGDNPRNQPNLRAECELAWITLRPPEEKKS